MRPISRGSQDEFVSLFEHTCGHVRARLDSRLRDQQLAVMVFAATYVEVWWLAGCHNGPDLDVLAWINKIVDRRVADALRRATPKAPLADAAQVDCAVTRARRAAVELATLLGRPVDTWIPYDLATTALEAEVRGMA
ncbi:hypothetical protein AB0368_30755 [Actinoplanes sp. NPDC051475]|uniref:hypothetical protein n=1 Tax=Actinoplanes sp. NPDC051475 TaxID=3157225 RepID=UPI00344E31FD